jgi:5,6-dimethylbenzimidazole synthase
MNLSNEEKEAVYKTIYSRRDTRSEFLDEPIEEEVLTRILDAAHHAPSVGFMQPWDFIIVNDKNIKQQIKKGFLKANEEAKAMFSHKRQEVYETLKLEGIEEAPLGICITCDKTRTGEVVLGRTHNLQMDLYSTVCAVQTLWLAARAENLGVGWVSIIDHNVLKQILNIPEHVEVVAYLCLGKVSAFHDKPELQKVGWQDRMNLEDLIHTNRW